MPSFPHCLIMLSAFFQIWKAISSKKHKCDIFFVSEEVFKKVFLICRTRRVTLRCTTPSRRSVTTCWPSCWTTTPTSWSPTTTASTRFITRLSEETQGRISVLIWVVVNEWRHGLKGRVKDFVMTVLSIIMWQRRRVYEKIAKIAWRHLWMTP